MAATTGVRSAGLSRVRDISGGGRAGDGNVVTGDQPIDAARPCQVGAEDFAPHACMALDGRASVGGHGPALADPLAYCLRRDIEQARERSLSTGYSVNGTRDCVHAATKALL